MASSKARMLTVAGVTSVLDALIPPSLAQEWDNVGLLVGDQSRRCRRLLLCIDLTPAVLDEAVNAGCDFVMAYHPPIFSPVKRLLADSRGPDAVIHRAVAAGIAVYSPHTALDAAPGGTNDVLAALVGMTSLEPFDYLSPPSTQSKVVTFVPGPQLDGLALAMSSAGAGRIGDYEQCSYRLHGQGTFFGTQAANPRVGRRGRLEKVAEVRLEMLCPNNLLPEVIDALLRAHPYEEPAYDIYPLSDPPSFGIGRVGLLPPRTTLRSLATKLKRCTGSRVLTIVGPPAHRLRRAAVCVGAAGRLPLDSPRSADCDVIITGEIRHHDALTIRRLDKTAVALGHWESERPVLPLLAAELSRLLPGLKTTISRRDTGPFLHP